MVALDQECREPDPMLVDLLQYDAASWTNGSDRYYCCDSVVINEKTLSSPPRMRSSPKSPDWNMEDYLETSGCLSGSESEQRLHIDLTNQTYSSYIGTLKESGFLLRSDFSQPEFSKTPDWYDEDLFKNAQDVYERHFMSINFAHLSGLLLLVRVDSIYDTLNATGESSNVSKLFKRYYHTLRHVKCWYEGNIFEENSEAQRSLMIVRGMHNRVSSNLNRKEESHGIEAEKSLKMHISEYDLMITQFAFLGFIVLNSKKMGLLADFTVHDLNSLLHFWRVIGYYLGCSEKYNLCSYMLNHTIGLCIAISDIEYKGHLNKNPIDSPPGIMSLNIVRSLKFIPMLTIYGILHHLYLVLGHETDEIDCRKNWYSNLSYTLIDLVMTRLLSYKPLRSFNNGLTRLSVYLVGKSEDWFSERLSVSYGQELRP